MIGGALINSQLTNKSECLSVQTQSLIQTKCLDTFGVMVYMGFSFMDELSICVGGPLSMGDKGENMIKIARMYEDSAMQTINIIIQSVNFCVMDT